MIIVAGTIRIDPDKANAFLPHAQKMLAATRKEDGCRVYSYAFDVEDAGLVRIYEEWDSRRHLEAHFKVPHMADWRAALEAIGAHSRAIKAYESEGGQAV